ncbi:MAG: BBE domain-containing protein [Longimicrobiales bacterium]
MSSTVLASRARGRFEGELLVAGDAGYDAARALARHASGAYVNVLTDEGTDGVQRAYPPHKLERLEELKNIYDPENVFHLNQNIQPRPRHPS